MPKTVVSPKWALVPEDYEKFVRDAFIFAIPALIVFLTVLQQGGSWEQAGVAVYTWFLSMLINLLQKIASEKTYVV
jgi:hypothetical protein